MSNGYGVVARTLAALGIRLMYGVIGIPVTELASAAQARPSPPHVRAVPSAGARLRVCASRHSQPVVSRARKGSTL